MRDLQVSVSAREAVAPWLCRRYDLNYGFGFPLAGMMLRTPPSGSDTSPR